VPHDLEDSRYWLRITSITDPELYDTGDYRITIEKAHPVKAVWMYDFPEKTTDSDSLLKRLADSSFTRIYLSVDEGATLLLQTHPNLFKQFVKKAREIYGIEVYAMSLQRSTTA